MPVTRVDAHYKININDNDCPIDERGAERHQQDDTPKRPQQVHEFEGLVGSYIQQTTPFEITSRQSVFSSLPSKRLFLDIRSNRKSCYSKQSIRSILIVSIVIIIILATVALMTMSRKTVETSSDSSSFEWNEDSKDTNIYDKQDDYMDVDEDMKDILGNTEPNPPPLPDSIILFHPPKSSDVESLDIMRKAQTYSDPKVTWDEYSKRNNQSKPENYPDFTYTADNHFSTKRTALLFAPGVYTNIDFEVGYYTQVLGLGVHPSDVKFTNCDKGPHVPATEKFLIRPPNGSGLDTFWRSIENIATEAREGMQWVVSQAAPLRRMHIMGDLNLFDGDAWVSGGVAANVVVDGKVNFGGQQQWLMRNVHLERGAEHGAWSLVFVGCTGNVPQENDGMKLGPSISVENDPGIRVEKPYITMLPDNQLELRVPAPTYGNDASGPSFVDMKEDIRNFRRVKLAVPSNSENSNDAAVENHSILQKALNEGKDLVLSPGIYPLSDSLEVKRDNQVILGLGYATLIAPENGSPCITVHPRVPGVRIAGIMLEASVQKDNSKVGNTKTLLEWGDESSNDAGDAKNPGVLSDVFARVGGLLRNVSTDVMIKLHSGNVYADQIWLWRADHTLLSKDEEPNFPNISTKYRQTVNGECVVKNGLVVGKEATNVTIVGLAVEHTTQDQTIWNGDNGQVYFYQSELPYDADQSFADNKFLGYKVGDSVTKHKAKGLGIYSNFRDHDVEVWTAVEHPPNDGIEMTNLFTVKLDNMGKINSVVNGLGPGPTSDDERGIPRRCVNNSCI